MLKSKTDARCLVFVGLCLLLLFPRSSKGVAQNAGSTVIVQPPLQVKGTAQVAPVGFIPSQVATAYGFDQLPNRGAGQTIGIVDAFDHPKIEDNLAVFDNRFHLPDCTTTNGCFQKIYASGVNPGLPSNKAIWALEIALDVEWAHAMAPDARIVLVEAQSDALSDMLQAVGVAEQSGATVISMSWGTPEFSGETDFDEDFVAGNVSFVAASGDTGTGVLYPAASPNVSGIGGTTLNVDKAGDYIGETAWSLSGGGLSQFEPEPSYQTQFNIPDEPQHHPTRGVPDVAYDADPNTGVAVYTNVGPKPFVGWLELGGTSAGTPQWAALLAIADSMRIAAGKSPLTGSNSALYSAATSSYSTDYHDITSGSNGSCGALCTAGPGYDYVTGLGSPQAANLANTLASAP